MRNMNMVKATVMLVVALFLVSFIYPALTPIFTYLQDFAGNVNLSQDYQEALSNTVQWYHWIPLSLVIATLIWFAIYTQGREPWWR